MRQEWEQIARALCNYCNRQVEACSPESAVVGLHKDIQRGRDSIPLEMKNDADSAVTCGNLSENNITAV